jgi:predicted metal-binding membrane protein
MDYPGDRILLSNQREGQVSRFHAWVYVVVPVTALVAAGYFFVWTAFGSTVFPLGVALAAIAMQQHAIDTRTGSRQQFIFGEPINQLM